MYRLLLTSVRGHNTLVGGPSVHSEDTVPRGGARFYDIDHVQRYVKRELSGIDSVWRVEVIATDSAAVAWRGTRAGRNGTGNTWTWTEVSNATRR